jgi:hypothetical protein
LPGLAWPSVAMPPDLGLIALIARHGPYNGHAAAIAKCIELLVCGCDCANPVRRDRYIGSRR